MRKLLQTHWPGILILLLALSIGIEVYQDYGMSIDESSQRDMGFAAYRYAKGEFDGDYSDYFLRDHGPGFDWVYIFYERLFKIESYRDIFLSRHLITYLLFIFSSMIMYIWVYKIFSNRWLASFSMSAIIFNPLLFGHAFFNPKDIPAMSIFLISMAVSYWAFTKNKKYAFLLLGLVCGYSTSIRLTNILIIAPIALFFLIDLIQALKQKKGTAHVFISGLLVCIGTCAAMYAFWPALWEDPIAGLTYAYETSTKYPWNGEILLGGIHLHSLNLPWSYIPTWFFITTPELFLFFGIIGIALLIVRVVDEPATYFRNTPMRNILMAFICFFLPVILVIIQRAILYDSWRHLYFIYPGFVLLMTFGFNELLKKKVKLLLWSICIVQFILIGRFMMKSHPFEHVYFNNFVPHDEDYLMKNYELDYWGTAQKQGLEWLADNDERYGIKILETRWLLQYNHMFLNDWKRDKFVFTWDPNEAEYYIGFFRTYPYEYPNEKTPDAKIVHERRILGSPVLRVVKLR